MFAPKGSLVMKFLHQHAYGFQQDWAHLLAGFGLGTGVALLLLLLLAGYLVYAATLPGLTTGW